MDLWNTETPIKDIAGLDCDLPSWLSDDISPSDVAAIVQGGCASGAYMPAVTYHQALATMQEHGDDVWDYLQEQHGEVSTPPNDISWSGLACFYLSSAVETWALAMESVLEEFEPEDAEA